ncbi:unnamed protein product [Parascedosporium putredinis]|uniref:Uncharacterized protein n=1 Tax=Parascedosporium putredinis TaxID=1442378 RepID=A0A9P1H5D5_9PEZI|nr:unnamed protein product [Parascedosporium putredinis]CAI7997825.1 unnamed protein product [Parascedosporium putredinis]
MEDIIGDAKVDHYQYKVLSILFAPFQHVLLLDADAWAIRDPAYLFHSEPYKSHGLVTFPDVWVSTAHPAFFEITDTPMNAPTERRTSESSVLMYDKGMHADSLILATYFNLYGPEQYYPLLSQHGPGEGDKETFLQAALSLGKPFYDVKENVGIVGRVIEGHHRGAAMIQHDPSEDWKLREYLRTHGKPMTKPSGEPVKASPLFIHHNIAKMDIYELSGDSEPLSIKTDEGKVDRLWGWPDGLYESAGFDIEKAMFGTIIRAKCEVMAPASECTGLWNFYRAAFGSDASKNGGKRGR